MRYFAKFKQSCTVRKDVLRLVESAAEHDWVSPAPYFPTHLVLPLHLFEADSDVTGVVQRYGSQARVKVFRFAPYTTYDWHTDSNGRSVAVNLLLNEHANSWVMYGKHDAKAGTHSDVEVLRHALDSYYLVDLQASHMVVNMSSRTRYVVTIGISESFQQVKRDLFKLLDHSTWPGATESERGT